MKFNTLLLHPKTKLQAESFITRPSHALLVTGPSGAGKTTIVHSLAEAVLETDAIENHPYFRKINAANGEGISTVREIRKFLQLKTAGRNDLRRVVVIERLDKLGTDAQNALLKVLEEPPVDTVLLLTATDTSQVLETILSRVSKLQILPVPKDVINNEFSDATQAYALSGGYAGSFKAIYDNSDVHPITTAVSAAKSFLGQTPFERLSQVEQLSKNKESAELLLDGLERCLHAALKAGKPANIAVIHKKLTLVAGARISFTKSVNTKLLLTNLSVNL